MPDPELGFLPVDPCGEVPGEADAPEEQGARSHDRHSDKWGERTHGHPHRRLDVLNSLLSLSRAFALLLSLLRLPSSLRLRKSCPSLQAQLEDITSKEARWGGDNHLWESDKRCRLHKKKNTDIYTIVPTISEIEDHLKPGCRKRSPGAQVKNP